MKTNQRVYESQDFNNIYLKVKHSMMHQKNLHKIKNRRNEYLDKEHLQTVTNLLESPRKKRLFEMSKTNKDPLISRLSTTSGER